jgi:4-amino-4-deoxy-L-arabinose transferase-like glycosyltransferase
MRQSADFLIPRLNGEYRFDKTPLIYWCQVLAFDILGESDFAARLPSVIFAALTAIATLMYSSRMFGPRIGLWSGILFATSLQVFIHSRAAVADMPLVFFFLTATWSDWERLRNPDSVLWRWTFYLSSRPCNRFSIILRTGFGFPLRYRVFSWYSSWLAFGVSQH